MVMCLLTSLVGTQGLGLARDQDEERVHHVHDSCLDEERPVAGRQSAHAAIPCTDAQLSNFWECQKCMPAPLQIMQ